MAFTAAIPKRQADADFDSDAASPTLSNGSMTRKQTRRRSSKVYQCLVEDCGKVYSRGDHLYVDKSSHFR